jgi:hypothetical protein
MAASSKLASFVSLGLPFRIFPTDAVVFGQANLQSFALLGELPLAGAAVVDPTTLHGWLEASVGGRLHASVQGQLQASVKGRLHANADEGD